MHHDTNLHTALAAIISPERVLTRPIERVAYASDASLYRLIPRAVVQPVSVAEVRALFAFSHAHRIPLTFRAAGTSLSGQAITDLQALFRKHDYNPAIIFGHAKDGNLHFVITPSFGDEENVRRFGQFMADMVSLVVSKYDGALKAEHGTGRNIAPFVETEWGRAAYQIMKDLKALIDPDGLLNPGVLVNPDPPGAPAPSEAVAHGRARGGQVHRVRLLRAEVP